MKKLLFSQTTAQRHWVGDGFPVRSIFSYNEIGSEVSPFLLLDYAGPEEFPPSQHIRGVGEHPHRGFETVTIVYAGEVEHKDSAGGGGRIGPGDVQWMTAASGLVHEEKHGKEFAKRGGKFEMIQLWVNLPAKDKMVRPKYQGLKDAEIPRVPLRNEAGEVRVIAGDYGGKRGPASTFSPINLWDMTLRPQNTVNIQLTPGHTVAFFVLSGKVKLADGEVIESSDFAVLEREGAEFTMEVLEDSKVLLLSGAPLNEPIVGNGPFVMNTKEEIQKAFLDFQQGKMGRIS